MNLKKARLILKKYSLEAINIYYLVSLIWISWISFILRKKPS